MVEKTITEDCSILDFRSYQQLRRFGSGSGVVRCSSAPVRLCRHCGAALLDGESDDDCSSAGVVPSVSGASPRRYYAE
jgi:hypothetical protein